MRRQSPSLEFPSRVWWVVEVPQGAPSAALLLRPATPAMADPVEKGSVDGEIAVKLTGEGASSKLCVAFSWFLCFC